MRDFKGTLWEGGVRVPCIARWPGMLTPGTKTPQVAITMDWSATFRRLAGLGLDPAGEDGIDMLPMLSGEKPVEERTLFWRRTNRRDQKNVTEGRSVRQGGWKYIELDDGESGLFDLANDVGEKQNLISDKPDLVETLRLKLDVWENEIDSSNP